MVGKVFDVTVIWTGWAHQRRGSRVVEFTRVGEAGLKRVFAFAPPAS